MLTGGTSTRMGRDKAALEIEGVAMADRVAAALRAAGAEDVMTIGGAFGSVPDDHPGAGPLGGVLTALRRATTPVTVVAPCDLLAPDPAAIGALLERLGAELAAVPAAERPLPIALRAAAIEPLAAAFAAGERSLRRAIAGLEVAVVELDPASVADADTPADLPRHRGPVGSGVMAVPEIDVAELARQRAAGAPLIDVREPDEWEEFRAPGAVLIPLGEVPERVDEVPADSTVYVICKSGGRSARAVEFLRTRGIDAVNVAGGTLAWRDAGEPVESGPA